MTQAEPRNLNTTINKFYGGMSVDDYIGTADASGNPMCFYDASALEINKQAKFVTLSQNTPIQLFTFNKSVFWDTVWVISNSWTSRAIFTQNWYAINWFNNVVYRANSNIVNSFIYNWFWNIIKTNGKIDRWPLSTTLSDTWIISTWTEILTNPTFASWTWWSTWIWWSIASNKATHIPWFVSSLFQNTTTVIWNTYTVEVEAVVNAWTCNLNVLSQLTPISSTWTYAWSFKAVWTTTLISLDALSSFDWYLTKVSMKLTNVVIDYADVTVPIPQNSAYIIDSWFLYLWVWSNIYKLDLSTSWYPSVKVLSLDIGYNIKGITQIWDRFYIYSSNGSDGMQYLWTGSTIITWWWLTKIRWKDRPILNVANINNVDYVITWTQKKRALYKVNWYQPELLYQSKFVSNSFNDRFIFKPDSVNSIETISNIVVIPADWCIYTWGKVNPWMPDSLVRKFTLHWNSPTCLYTDEWDSYNLYYFNSDSNNIYGYQQLLTDKTNYSLDPATLIFNPIISNLYSSHDSALKTRVWYDLQPNTLINVYFKPDYQGGYANFYVNTFSGTYPVIWDTYTFSWITYTVYEITVSWTLGIIHCTFVWWDLDLWDINDYSTSWTMTKTSWTGISTFNFYRRTLWMKFVQTISDTTTHKLLISAEDPCYQMTFMLDLITYDSNMTPRLWDFVYAYQEIENDI